jgi:hypothetical protein
MVGVLEPVDQGGGEHRVTEDLAHASKPRLLMMIEPRS